MVAGRARLSGGRLCVSDGGAARSGSERVVEGGLTDGGGESDGSAAAAGDEGRKDSRRISVCGFGGDEFSEGIKSDRAAYADVWRGAWLAGIDAGAGVRALAGWPSSRGAEFLPFRLLVCRNGITEQPLVEDDEIYLLGEFDLAALPHNPPLWTEMRHFPSPGLSKSQPTDPSNIL